MTREEAIDYLQDAKNALPHKFDKSLDMAIESLSAPSGDLISRADAMAEFREWVKRANENGKTPTWNDAVSLIGSLPSADAVHGEWEHWGSPFSDESEVIDTIVCSVCGARFIEPNDEPKGEYNFCPNCGAKMDGERREP